MSYADVIVWTLAAFLVLVTFMNPGGLIIGGLIAFLVLASYYGLPWIGGLIRDRQRGKSAAKANRGARKRLRGGNDK